MLLACDVGNTNVVFGVFVEGHLERTFRIGTTPTRTADEYDVLLRQLLTLREIHSDDFTASIIASVVPPLTETIAEAVRAATGHRPLVVGPGTKTGISVLYENPREVGADRIVNAVAAYERVHQGVIIVDFGTATTFDCVSPKAEYLGGVIVPGMQISLDALLRHAAKLSRVEIAEPPRVMGRNTTHALQAGIIHGYASLVDGLIEKLSAELVFPVVTIATGGLAPLIARHTRSLGDVDLDLTLQGLRIIHERNDRRDSRP